MAIKAFLFDLDKTLYENNEGLEDWARENVQKLFDPAQSEKLMRVLQEMVLLFEHPAGGREDCAALISRLMPDISDQAVEFLTVMQADWLNNMQLTPDAQDLLNTLDNSHIPYGIVTNAPAIQKIKIGMLGLNERVKCILISEIFGVDKPDPRIFCAAAEAIGVPTDQIMFVGDSPEHDIVGARAAGMRSTWLCRGRSWPQELSASAPDFVVDSLTDVTAIVSGGTKPSTS